MVKCFARCSTLNSIHQTFHSSYANDVSYRFWRFHIHFNSQYKMNENISINAILCTMSIVLFVPIPSADFSFSSLFLLDYCVLAFLSVFLSFCLYLFLRNHLTDTKYVPPQNRHKHTYISIIMSTILIAIDDLPFILIDFS